MKAEIKMKTINDSTEDIAVASVSPLYKEVMDETLHAICYDEQLHQLPSPQLYIVPKHRIKSIGFWDVIVMNSIWKLRKKFTTLDLLSVVDEIEANIGLAKPLYRLEKSGYIKRIDEECYETIISKEEFLSFKLQQYFEKFGCSDLRDFVLMLHQNDLVCRSELKKLLDWLDTYLKS